MRDSSARQFLGFAVWVVLLALGGACGLILRVVLGGGGGWGVFVLPLALVLGMAGWGAIAFAAGVINALRERSASALLRPLPDPPGAFCIPLGCFLSGPLLGLSVEANWMAVSAGTVTAAVYGALAYGLVRARWLEPAAVEGGEP